MTNFLGKDILALRTMTREEIEKVFAVAREFEEILDKRTKSDLLSDKILATLFFQPSTRTRLSFESAMQRLGGTTIGFASPEASRAGDETAESLADTARVVEHYADVVAMRHFRTGAVAEFAEWCSVPVLNGGDGYGGRAEHPTQGLLDLYTMLKEFGQIDGLKIFISGDLNTRSKHSSIYGLSKFKNITLYHLPFHEKPNQTELSEEILRLPLKYVEVDSIETAIVDSDVFFPGWAAIPGKTKTPEPFILTKDKLKGAKKDLIVMHQLPRLDEMPVEIDNTPYARYFEESRYGVPIRMALLALVVGAIQ